MSKKPPTGEQYEVYRHYLTARPTAKIAEQYGISVRTVFRWVQKIRAYDEWKRGVINENRNKG